MFLLIKSLVILNNSCIYAFTPTFFYFAGPFISFSENSKQDNHIGHFKSTENFQCTQCSYATRWKADLKRHFRRHTGEKPFTCPVCYRLFSHSSSLKQHMIVHIKNNK